MAQVFWNYLTAGISACSEDPTAVKGSDLYTSKGIGSSYVKAQYVQYTDRTFTVRTQLASYIGAHNSCSAPRCQFIEKVHGIVGAAKPDVG